MTLEEQRRQKIDEAVEILKKFGMPKEQQNEPLTVCFRF